MPPDQIFNRDALRQRAVELLRKHGTSMPIGTVAIELGVPLYAADAALEAAYSAREAVHEAGVGWTALPPAEMAPTGPEIGLQGDLDGVS